MGAVIASIDALEILDSRGNPTLKVYIGLDNGDHAAASVPSGASTGEHEAHELRDGDAARYNGKGVLRALSNITQIIAPKIVGIDPTRQRDIDELMIELDGTENKSRLGANAILGVSMAAARAGSQAMDVPLYRYLGGPEAFRMPVPMMNVINGGAHARNSLDFQEFMLVPHGAPTFSEALRYSTETFSSIKRLLEKLGHIVSVGDEGGFAPQLPDNEEACNIILEAIHSAGFKRGTEIAIALDPAASTFFVDGRYLFKKSGEGSKTAQQLIDLYSGWADAYPIVSIEDGLDENDWGGFSAMTAALGNRIQIVGDDLFVTNTKFIQRGIVNKAANAVLIKLNQIGTVTEAIRAIELCRSAGWQYIISHRSGETEDAFIADFAVAMGGAQIKTGSLSRSERTAKYNRLLEIERELGAFAVFESPFWTKINTH